MCRPVIPPLFWSGICLYWLHDHQRQRIKELLPAKSSDRSVMVRDDRRFVEAVLWIARTDAPWRDLPEAYGHWQRV
ncbi:transposase [Pseudomonas nitroreducens]|uniref:transposase n=1 Tax=Pseudomonas nitroreducens TaxID=46680 RepID=UPI003908A785